MRPVLYETTLVQLTQGKVRSLADGVVVREELEALNGQRHVHSGLPPDNFVVIVEHPLIQVLQFDKEPRADDDIVVHQFLVLALLARFPVLAAHLLVHVLPVHPKLRQQSLTLLPLAWATQVEEAQCVVLEGE